MQKTPLFPDCHPGSLITTKALLREVPVNRETIWRWMRDGKFPKPVNANRRGALKFWRAADVRAWADEQFYSGK